MNVGDVVMVKNQEQYDRMPVEIISIIDEKYTVRVLDNNVELTVKAEDLKKRRMCTCGRTDAAPFCDSSHMKG